MPPAQLQRIPSSLLLFQPPNHLIRELCQRRLGTTPNHSWRCVGFEDVNSTILPSNTINRSKVKAEASHRLSRHQRNMGVILGVNKVKAVTEVLPNEFVV